MNELRSEIAINRKQSRIQEQVSYQLKLGKLKKQVKHILSVILILSYNSLEAHSIDRISTHAGVN